MPYHRKAKSLQRMLALGGFAALVVTATSVACNGSAVGVEACQRIEETRCELTPKLVSTKPPICQGLPIIKTATEVQSCKILYRDHCRVGIENTAKEPSKDQIDGCVAALNAVAGCAVAGQVTLDMCSGATLADPTTATSISPCYAFEHPEVLAACSFVVAMPGQTTSTTAATTSATTGATTSSTTGAGGAAGG